MVLGPYNFNKNSSDKAKAQDSSRKAKDLNRKAKNLKLVLKVQGQGLTSLVICN